MAKKGSFSKVYDKNGDYVDVEAARFDGTRTFQMQGDVTASQTWNGDSASALTLNTSIGAKKVTTDKINDKAVQTGQIDDGAVGLTQIATNAMNGTVQDNDSKLATHAAVKTYVDAQISGQGTYLGKHTVAEINAMVTDNLHNGDRVMTSDSGTINLGPGGVGFDVEAGEDLILYKSGSTVQWDSMDGNFKTKQTAVSDPTASGTGLTFIDSASQDENGEMTLSKKTVQDGTTSQKGVVQLEDSHSSTSTTKAATPNSVKEAYDLANTANTGAVKNVAYDSTNKKITKTINGTTTDVVSAATLKTDMALNNVDNTSDANKPVSTAQQAALDLKLDKTGDGKDVTATFTEASTRANIGTGEKLSVIFGKIKKWFTDLGTAAFKNVPASGNASSTEVVLGSDTRLSAGASAVQDVTVDGTSVVNSSTKVAAVPNASTSAKGAVQLAGSIGATVASENNKAATEKAVRDAINALDAEVTSNDGTNVQVKVTEADGKISAVNVTTDNTENKNNKVTSVRAASSATDTAYPSEKAVATALNAKADANKVVAIADAVVSRMGTTGWFKVAERSYNQVNSTAGGTWAVTIISASKNITCHYTIDLNIRAQASGTNAAVRIFSSSPLGLSASDNYDNFRCVLNGTSGSLTIELWYYAGGAHESMMLSELATGVYDGRNTKFGWTYYNISSSAAGSETAPTGNVVKDIDFVYAQKPVANATSGNFAGLDANGLLTDSGKKAADFATAAQGTKADSAIQGVKVNNTTLTPDANKVVTVPLATTSADGAMSAADKTKLNGIAEGAEANVQADWDENSSSSDAFIKNKPFYSKSIGGTAEIFKVCLFPIYSASSTSSGSSIDVQFRYGNGSVFGRLSYKNGFKLTLTTISEIATSRYFKLFYVVGDVVEIYAQATNSYLEFKAAPSMNMPKSSANFTNFGTVVSALPEGATEITPVWVVNSASSSGTAPVKVDAYGALTPVSMDSTPTASSTNLMTSGDIKTALDAKQDSLPTSGIASSTYAINISGTAESFKKATGNSAGTARYAKLYTIDTTSGDALASGIVISYVARDANNNNKAGFIRFRPTSTNPTGYVTILNSGHLGNTATTRFGYCKNSDNKYEVWALLSIYSRITAQVIARDSISYTVHNEVYETTQPTGFEFFAMGLNVTKADNQAAVGSTSIPTYVDSDGEIKACTDDFVHDGDVAQTYSSTSEAPISGKGVTEKNLLKAVTLTSSDSIDNLTSKMPVTTRGTRYLFNGSTDVAGTFPETKKAFQLSVLVQHEDLKYLTQELWYTDIYNNYHYTRKRVNSTWQDWKIHWDEATSSYSSSGTQPVNGTAVAAALNAEAVRSVQVETVSSAKKLTYTKNSGTGGAAVKTDILEFMTTAEAQSLWTNAKNAVAAS